MQIIDIKGTKWTVGLEWEILPGDQSVKVEAKEVAEKTNSNVGILVDYDSQFAIGLAKKANKIPSAARYLAYANQEIRNNAGSQDSYLDWIVVEEVSDDKFWISVIKNGIPSPQYDTILDITTVKDRITELLINDTFKLYSTCPEIRQIFEGLKDVEEIGLNSLVQDVKLKNNYLKLRGIPDGLIYTGIGVMVVGVALYGVSSFFEGRSIREKAEIYERQKLEDARIKQEQYQSELKIYNKNKAELKDKKIKEIAISIASSPPSILHNWYNTIGSIQLKTHGWNLDSMECYMIPPSTTQYHTSACDILYKRTGLSTNRMILEDYPNIVLKGDEAVLTVPVEINSADLISMSEADLNTIPTASNWGFNMTSQLQLLKIVNIDHEIKASADITYPSPLKPVSPEEAAQGIQPVSEGDISLGVSKGEIIIKNDNYELIKEIADNVQFFGIGVKKAKFKVSGLGKIDWEVSLDYFVRNDSNGGISNSNSSSLSNTAVEKTEDGATLPPPQQ
ncbi:MAG: hypothetical protein C0448_16035 [Sphingobacteriaceae bacterium]|nr:hypothetical protein [Sphingobacteriaceae bacterium]